MTLREQFLPLIDQLDAEVSKREDDLKQKEVAQVKSQEQFNASVLEFGKKETALVEWEATLRDREETSNTSLKTFQAEKTEFENKKKEFQQWHQNELGKIEALQTKLEAERQSLEMQKEDFDKEKKEQGIIRSKLVAERASLDSAWNELNYAKLKA